MHKTIVLLLLVFISGMSRQVGIDRCKPFISYEQCIQSKLSKCLWNQLKKQCTTTSDYLKGCNPNLNLSACQSQIGDVQEKIAKCRFASKCEEIPDLMAEKCLNNLNKSGCLSIKNPSQVCVWKENKCSLLEQEDYGTIQKNFDIALYSVSACSHIEHYLVVHHYILWELLGYSPNIMLQANIAYLQDEGIETNKNQNYDDPTEIQLQNNIVTIDGQFKWYTMRESKSVTLRNLRISDRYREGCIAIEIENDSDYEIIFNIEGTVLGVNHVYCKYLSRLLTSTPSYVFTDGQCRKFDQTFLNDQKQIDELNLNCFSFNVAYCIYFDSLKHQCQIYGEEYEYPCQPLKDSNNQNCDNSINCTVQQCKQFGNSYIDNKTNVCTNTCYILQNQYDCQNQQDCIYLGNPSSDSQLICSPPMICDQIGVSLNSCKYLKAKCQWDYRVQRCFSITDDQIQFLKCEDVVSIYVCTYITLSDQLCYWDSDRNICSNVLNQPILLTYGQFIGFYDYLDFYHMFYSTISNFNLCQFNEGIYSHYNEDQRICNLTLNAMIWNDSYINKYNCLNSEVGFCKWNQRFGKCECPEQDYFTGFLCQDLIDVNEKCCQFALTSNSNFICIFNSIDSNCYEKERDELINLSCEGNGLSKQLCLSKELCRYQAYLCGQLDNEYINSLSCSTFHNINHIVCEQHNNIKDSELCDYDEKTSSCYSPSKLNEIKFKVTLNRFACERVIDFPTYYDVMKNLCLIFDEDDQLFSKFTCEDYFLSKMACELIVTDGQLCNWDSEISKCKQLTLEFARCGDYSGNGERVCQGLERNLHQTLIKENFCQFIDGECQSVFSTTSDCGESQKMNIHRCNSLTGLDENGSPIKMCSFINLKCISLNEAYFNDQLILNQIECKQANFAACIKISTPGQFCVITINQSVNKAVLDQKCVNEKKKKLNCSQLNQLYDQSKINKNFCVQAQDACQFKENFGCTSPSSENLACEDYGLSKSACQIYTIKHRCAFINNKCQYLSDNVFLNDCSLLNKFLCQNYKYEQCIWKENTCLFDEDNESITEFTCSRDQTQNSLAYYDGQCIFQEETDLQNFTCESVGLNKYTCQKLNQYCIFQQNQCQYSRTILCEDSGMECSSNNTQFQNCVLKDQKCFHIKKELKYECDEFEETNFNFCYQFPECVYYNKKCLKRRKPNNSYCGLSADILNCVFYNAYSLCYYDTDINYCTQLHNVTRCYSFEGYYSKSVCNSIENCHYGHTKGGLGFCYEGNITDITCELLPKMFCTEELSPVNKNLNCYYDGQCKTLQKENQTCSFLSKFTSNYSACALVSISGDCNYSHPDQICKSTLEYLDSVCQGETLIQCSQIKNICYFEEAKCQYNGQVQNLNKYGCLNQQGLWQFVNFKCIMLSEDTILNSCSLISKDTCLSSITKELSCRWDNETIKCVQVFEIEGQLIEDCENLNERACINIRSSTLQCFYDTNLNVCQKLSIQENDCSLVSSEINVSMSLCSNQLNKPCILNDKDKKCEILNIQIDSCSKYGLNEIACINNTTDYCQWFQINNGSYCKQANLFTALCDQGLNKKSCQNLKTRGQYCIWIDSLMKCEKKEITNCQSASYLNLQYPCFAVKEEKCFYSYVTNECIKLETNPIGCNGDIYNSVACLYNGQNCIWKNNKCMDLALQECGQQQSRKRCMSSQWLSCEWKNEECIPYFNSNQQHCNDLPKNINDSACRSYSKEICEYNVHRDECYAELNIVDGNFDTIFYLLQFQDKDFTSPILSGECEDLQLSKDCINSRKQDQACKWKDSCKQVEDFQQLMCNDNLNIYGCLGVTTQNQFCMWQGKCFEWDQSFHRQTNVNINVCKQFSVNKIYKNYSCFPINIDEINCQSPGISKETCLSITKSECEWNNDLGNCVEFKQQNQQKCIEYQQVSPYVCQMQKTDSCKHNKETKNCEEVEKNSLARGISMKACLQNVEKPIYWDGEICQIFDLVLECNEQLIVNHLSCVSRTTQPCLYDSNKQICTSKFNEYSIRCTTQGINKLACFKVQTEPCIFFNGKCQEFKDVNSPCNQLRDVNSKACASIQSEICEYNQIEYYCQTPKILNEICNVDGINKNLCQLNKICKWNDDYKVCKCQENQIIEQCQQEKITDCLENSNCIFENNICRLKQCYHLSKEDCNYVFLNSNFCYLSQNGGCESAQRCDDIIDTSIQCSAVYINSIPCLQGKNFCYSHDNYEVLCPNSDCLQSQCVQELGQCRIKICSDYDLNDCNKQNGCYLNFFNKCEELIACNLISEEIFAIAASSLCNQVSVNNIKCNWQQISVFNEEEKYCTNQYCELYRFSVELCHGNEINNVACILSNAFLCQSCEEIKEECFCNSLVNICKFEKGQCISILCEQFQTQNQCIEAKTRCYWSASGNCLLNCNKLILADECNQRENECYYDYTLNSCLSGKKAVPNLNVDITIEQFYGNMLRNILIIILVIQ